jgi:hypothetical protein
LPSCHSSFNPFLLNRGEVRTLVDHGDFLARESKPGRQQATDGACANHANPLLSGRGAQQVRTWQYLIENVAEAANAIDDDVDDVMGITHGTGTKRSAAGDDIAGHQRHVFGNRGDKLMGWEEHVGDRVVLPFLAVQDRFDRQFHRIDIGRNYRPEYAKGVKTLRARPLFERFILAQQIDCGDIIHAGIAKDIVAGLRFADVETFLADDDAKLALVDDLSSVGCRTLDWTARGPVGIRSLQEPERLFRLLEIVLRGELMEIIPQADHLRRLARRRQPDIGQLQRLAGRLRSCEHVAAVHCNRFAFDRAEPRFPTPLKANPMSH